MRNLGTWNPATNEPVLADGEGQDGDFYICSVDGRTELDGNDIWKRADHVKFVTDAWTRVNNQPVDPPSDSVALTGAGVTAQAVLEIGTQGGEGTQIVVQDEIVTLTNAVETDLAHTVPAGAVILSVQANLETLVVGDASGDNLGAKVGIGTTADPDKYGITSALTANLKIDTLPDWAVLGSEETVTVKLAKTDGSAATEKFVAGGLVRVRIVYLRLTSLANA